MSPAAKPTTCSYSRAPRDPGNRGFYACSPSRMTGSPTAYRRTSGQRMPGNISPGAGSSKWVRSRNSGAARSRPSRASCPARSTYTGRPMGAQTYPCRGSAVEIDTSEADKRAAQRVEDQLKAEMKVAHKAGKRVVIAEAPAAAPALTFGAAVSEYIERVVSLHESQMHRCNTGWSLEWLVREIGAERPLFQIDNRLVSDVVARRRGERGRHGQLLSKTTINRSVTEPLRKVLRHAARLNELSLKIDWNLHLLDEPEEIVRELQTGEEERLFAADVMRTDYEPALRIALLLGLRAG